MAGMALAQVKGSVDSSWLDPLIIGVWATFRRRLQSSEECRE